jgi:hypothetical protein
LRASRLKASALRIRIPWRRSHSVMKARQPNRKAAMASFYKIVCKARRQYYRDVQPERRANWQGSRTPPSCSSLTAASARVRTRIGRNRRLNPAQACGTPRRASRRAPDRTLSASLWSVHALAMTVEQVFHPRTRLIVSFQIRAFGE